MSKARLRVALFFVLTWLGVALLLVFLLTESRRAAEHKAASDALAIASQVEAQLVVVLRYLQVDLNQLSKQLPRDVFAGGATGEASVEVTSTLHAALRSMPDIVGLQVLDVGGNLVHGVGMGDMLLGHLDRRQFVHRVASGSGMLYISEADRDPVGSGLPVALAVRGQSGEFLGVIVASLRLDVIVKAFAPFELGSAGSLDLRSLENGGVILRRPDFPERVRRVLVDEPVHERVSSGERKGLIRSVSPLDGVERTVGFMRIGEHPVYVVAGLATQDYLAEWRQTLLLSVASAALLFLVLLLLMIRMLRAERVEAMTAARLAESEARYRMLAENSHDVIWTLDIHSRAITYVSPSVLGLCGYRQEELLGQEISSCLTPESADKFAREIDMRLRRIAAGDPDANVLQTELDQVCKDGRVISTEVVSSYLLDHDGVPRTILGITRNVSERKVADLALRETNRQLQVRIDEIGRLQVALQELAVRDSLTGLYNRRYLDETLEREVSRARREGSPLSVVMLDIDHFKRINDTYGHQVGDEALRLLAKTLHADVRAEDVVCRYGGEEFLILLPHMPLDTALERAEAWRGAVARLSLTLGDFPISFTVSLGVSAYPEHGKTPDDLTRCADQALYRAKHEGRNQVVVYSA